MPETIADYRDHVLETMKAFDEDHVLLVSQGKEGPPNAMAIGRGTIGIIWRKPISQSWYAPPLIPTSLSDKLFPSCFFLVRK